MTVASLTIARKNLHAELQEFCELGAISVGVDGVITPQMSPDELAKYDDGTLQTLIDSQVSIAELFCKQIGGLNFPRGRRTA